jgi:crossover junction endodeoxyribonuclease RuvC
MTESIYIGLDLSLTSTGFVALCGEELVASKVVKAPNGCMGVARLAFLRIKISELIDIYHRPIVVGIEGYSYGSRGRTFEIGELGGIIRLLMAEKNLTTYIIPPTSLKKFATGKGNCGKPQVGVAVYRKWKMEFPSDDICDAYVLARMVAAKHEDIPVTTYEALALDGMEQILSGVRNRSRS